MINSQQQTGQKIYNNVDDLSLQFTEKPEINLLEEWLAKISEDHLAYIKGASQALLYAQEEYKHSMFNVVE